MSTEQVTREEADREITALLARAGEPPLEHRVVAEILLDRVFGQYRTIRRMVLDQVLTVLREQFNLPASH